jgi:hypothetical protein
MLFSAIFENQKVFIEVVNLTDFIQSLPDNWIAVTDEYNNSFLVEKRSLTDIQYCL